MISVLEIRPVKKIPSSRAELSLAAHAGAMAAADRFEQPHRLRLAKHPTGQPYFKTHPSKGLRGSRRGRSVRPSELSVSISHVRSAAGALVCG